MIKQEADLPREFMSHQSSGCPRRIASPCAATGDVADDFSAAGIVRWWPQHVAGSGIFDCRPALDALTQDLFLGRIGCILSVTFSLPATRSRDRCDRRLHNRLTARAGVAKGQRIRSARLRGTGPDGSERRAGNILIATAGGVPIETSARAPRTAGGVGTDRIVVRR